MRRHPPVALAALALSVAACGGADRAVSGGAAGTAPAASTGSAAATGTPVNLTITVRASRTAAPRSYTLTCAPVGGSLPTRAAACGALGRLGPSIMKPLPPGIACPAVYGGPARADIVGTIGSRRVDLHYGLSNGCELARWRALVAAHLVPPPTEPVPVTAP